MADRWQFLVRGAAVFWLALPIGCHSVSQPVAGPTLELDEFFDGVIDVEGAVRGPLGGVRERYAMVLEGEPHAGGVRITEALDIRGGASSRTDYWMRELDDGRFAVSSDDFIGSGVGERFGPGIRWRYTMVRKEGLGAGIRFRCSDTMIPRDPDTLDNHVEIRKLGLRVGHVEQVMRKR